MTEATFSAALSNARAYFRAAQAAGTAGDPGAISAELVRAALVLGVQLGQLQMMHGPAYTNTKPYQAISRSLHELEATAISAFAAAERHKGDQNEPVESVTGPTAEYLTPYDGPAYGS